MKRKKYSFIILLLLIMGIGYATLSTSLSITGLNVFKGNTWDVHFDNLTVKSFNSATPISATLSNDKKSIEIEASFTYPGEEHTFYVDVLNDGTIDAMLDSLEVENLSQEVENIIEVNVYYLDGEEVSQYDLLRANSKDTLKIVTTYKEDIQVSDLPDEDTDFSYTITASYIQSDNNALARTTGEEDEDIPVIQSISITPGVHNITVSVDAYDQYSGIAKYYYSKDNGVTYVSSSSPNYTFTTLDDDDYQVKAYVEDITGNSSIVLSGETNVTTIYAIEYTDNTLVLNHSGNVDENKTVSKNYGNISEYNRTITKIENVNNSLVTSYEYQLDTPWYKDEYSSTLLKVDIEEKIVPNTTAEWFSECSKITEVAHIENLDTSRVTNMSKMFNRASKLTSLDVSHFNTSKVTNMSQMFYATSKLPYLDVTHFNTSNVVDMSDMFGYMGNGLETTTIDVSGFDTSNVINMSGMFRGNVAQTLNVSGFNTSKVTDMSMLFDGTSKVTSLAVSGWDTRNVVNMSRMFEGARSLQSLDLSRWNTSNVETIMNMFRNATSLTSLDVNGWDTTKITNLTEIFEKCESLTSLDLSSWDISNVTWMNMTFDGDINLTNITFGEHWDTSQITNMSYVFRNCQKLEGLDLSSWDTRKVGSSVYCMLENTSKNATNKVWYYGPNSTNIYTNRSEAVANYITLTYKAN